MKKFETLAPALAMCGWLVAVVPVQAQDSVGVTAAIRNSVQTRSSASAPKGTPSVVSSGSVVTSACWHDWPWRRAER